MLVEIVGDDLYFNVLSEKGETIDAGSIHRTGKIEPSPERSTQPVVPGTPAPKNQQ
jgi:hypothetical protein